VPDPQIHIRRSRADSERAELPLDLLHDPRLSDRAVGALLRALFGGGRKSGAEAGQGRRGEGRDGTAAIRREWEAAGYLVREFPRSERGQLATILNVYDTPQVTPATGNPSPDRPGETPDNAGHADNGKPVTGGHRPAKPQVAPTTENPSPVTEPVTDAITSPQVAPETPYPASADPSSVRPASTSKAAGRTDDGKPVANLDLDRQIDLSISLTPGTVRELLAQVDPSVDDTVAEEVAAELRRRGVLDPARVLYRREIPAGHGPTLIAEARRRIAARRPGTPSAPHREDQCRWCSDTRHDTDDCPSAAEARAPASPLYPVGVPAHAVARGSGHEEFERTRAAMKARTTGRTQVPADPVYPDDTRDVLSEDYGDGDHAA
jgi:hypothetical protein